MTYLGLVEQVRAWLRKVTAPQDENLWESLGDDLATLTAYRPVGNQVSAVVQSPQMATFDDVKAYLGLAPSDTSADGYLAATPGMDVVEAAVCVARAMFLSSGFIAMLENDWQARQRAGVRQVVINPALNQQALQNTVNQLSSMNALAQTAFGQYNQQPPLAQQQHLHASTANNALQNAANQLGMANVQTTGPRRAVAPDPVSDPYLAANDFCTELEEHLGLTDGAVGALPVRAYMLWVAIRAARKDGEAWADMDRRLHELAGVAYTEQVVQVVQAEPVDQHSAAWTPVPPPVTTVQPSAPHRGIVTLTHLTRVTGACDSVRYVPEATADLWRQYGYDWERLYEMAWKKMPGYGQRPQAVDVWGGLLTDAGDLGCDFDAADLRDRRRARKAAALIAWSPS